MIPQNVQKCIDACNECMKACEQCFSACLQEPDVGARVHCISMLRDCADICSLTAQYLARNSMSAKQICSLCASICEACAEHCSKFKDEHCKTCVEMCKKCAEVCRNMAA
ncbi:four-helix bundle copper-binding protein [Paenibacillus agricola]|uniref:Four-helix bundle copper-binding protein n=1 Tax=Paenibacillus agricola TaxID=2716264 RepID=A0ABX0JDH7_9BACL|nr:four-helix bundle copper-binding protein [Paenibacillus agricola]